MLEVADILNRLAAAVQLAVVMCLVGYFALLARLVDLREVRQWRLAWLADLGALAAVLLHSFAGMPELGHRLSLVAWLAGKTLFALFIVAGARRHLLPGAVALVSPRKIAAFVAAWSLTLGLGVPELWHAQLAESALLALLFLAAGLTVLRNPRSRISRWLGWAMVVEGLYFAWMAVLILPGLWGNAAGFGVLAATGFGEAWADLMLGLACIAVVTDQREEQLHYANRELLESHERLGRLVDTDPLTALASRRHLRRALDAVRTGGGALVFIDVNRLRDINALFGQPIGDHSLQRLARLISRHFRAEDHLIRWGGDEFLVVAPGMDEGSARTRVAAIREELGQPARELPPLSIAAGVAPLEAGADAAAALEEADRRMVADKPGGGSG
jgi:diguanylate cyclase (GGDEF)-like protein